MPGTEQLVNDVDPFVGDVPAGDFVLGPPQMNRDGQFQFLQGLERAVDP